MLEDYIPYMWKLVSKFMISKVTDIIPGGETGQDSIYNGLKRAQQDNPDDSVVLIHDGVRPLIDEETISANIESVKTKGSAITVTPAIETITIKNETGEIGQIIERSKVEMARAPQSFYLKDILDAHFKAEEEKIEFIDSASLMQHYGHKLYTVEGSPENIKITTPNDFYTFRALVDARENTQILGI
jgi:2-C-methyl-D-erythritol 4-phosphate cytidylyltransferase